MIVQEVVVGVSGVEVGVGDFVVGADGVSLMRMESRRRVTEEWGIDRLGEVCSVSEWLCEGCVGESAAVRS